MIHSSARLHSRALVLDVDNTLTPPRRPLQEDMALTVRNLVVPFFLAAGSDLNLIEKQFIHPLHGFGYRGTFDAFLCNGSTRYRVEINERVSVKLIRDFDLKTHLGQKQFQKLMQAIVSTLRRKEFDLPSPLRVIGDQITDRRAMLNVAPIGRPRETLSEDAHFNRQLFEEYDKRTGFRLKFLAHLKAEVADLIETGLHISLGGQTSFDIVIKGNDKSYAVSTLLDEGFERLWYVGDALFEGGNDEAVLKFVQDWRPTNTCPVEIVPVKNCFETVQVFSSLQVLKGAASPTA